MATLIEYSQEKELDEALQEQLDDPTISAILADKVKVVACFCTRTKDDDTGTTVRGKGDPVKIKKVSPEAHIFMKPKAHFILVVDYGFWEEAKPDAKRCEIYRALTRIQVDKTEGDPGFKLKTRPWMIQDNPEVIKKFGAHNDTWVAVAEVLRSRLLSVTQGVIDRRRAEADPDPEPEPEPEEKPRVVARAVPKKSAPDEDDEPRRPARKIPPEPAKKPAAADEPEPEPVDE